MATAPVALGRWGVHVARESPAPARAEALGVVVIANPSMSAQVSNVAQALAALAPNTETEFLVILDAAMFQRDHRLWRRMKKAGLLDRASIVPGLESRREPVLGADIVIAVTAPGEHRSTVLDAMGHGRAVVLMHDELCDWIHPDETCIAVNDFQVDSWKHGLAGLIASQERRAELGRTALEFTRVHGVASRQVSDTLTVYERALAPLTEVGPPLSRQ